MGQAVAFCRGHWQLLALSVLIAVLWQTPLVLPLKILVVFLHEVSHVLATVLTGGEVLSLTLDPREGGMVISRGGNRFMTLSAGYTGSLMIGAMLFLLALRTTWDRLILAALGIVLIIVCALYIRSWFALGFTCVMALSMLLAARFLGREANDLILRVIGLTSMIYVPLDIFSDTIARSHLRSDAYMLAEEFGGSTMFWGVIWLLISLAVICPIFWRGLGANSNIRPRHSKA